ncbi:hypothetical protein DPMN_053570 [Dreissena polymorpha]|uniref:Uncharacterized protein n=1 Tax=Dreissena polymorpha TaxID=45954 RepID=A0A9D4HQT1_DREPO|nr:hypothetical protein DPMN_053570 [Dreissena polymorpha]
MDLVNEIVLESGIAILSGGKAKDGTPLLTFPTDATDLFEIYATFYVTLAASDHISVIAELSSEWTDDCISKLSTILNELQLTTRRVKEAYLVKTDNPIEMLDFSKYRSAALTIYECQVIFLDSYADLHALVDRDQLTTDYGGTLQYNHRSWVDFHKAYYPIIDEASSTKNMLFDIARCVRHALGKRRDALDGTDALDTFATVRNKKAVFLDLELERVLEDGQESLEKLQHPEFDPILVKLPAGFLNNAVATLNDNLVKIKECSELVKTHFEEMEMEINMYHSLKECKYQVEEVVETICLMRQEAEDLPDIGSNSWEAFHNRQYFIKHILTPSKEIVDCADSVLADLHAVGMKTGSSSRTRTMEDQLKAELESFTLRINQLNETYMQLLTKFGEDWMNTI